MRGAERLAGFAHLPSACIVAQQGKGRMHGGTGIGHLDYRAREPISGPIFGIAVHRLDGVHVTGPNTSFSSALPPAVAGEGTVTYSIPSLTLLDGYYQLTAAVVNHNDTEVYDYHDRAYAFQVVNQRGSRVDKYGLMTLGGTWLHEASAVPAGWTDPAP
jgi:hypothetical protein